MASVLYNAARLHRLLSSFRPQPIPRYCNRRTFSSTFHPRNQYIRFDDSGTGSGRGPKDPRGWRQRDAAIKFGIVGFSLCTAYYVAHLEQVPETGRWRYMDVGPELEARIAQASQAEIHSEFRDRILPPNHPLTLHVQGIVQRILSASNLGVVKTPHPTFIRHASMHPDEDLWSTDADSGVAAGEYQDKARVMQREWDVVVINDQKVVNAAATPGIVFVFTGMLPITQDDDGLAAVLSHEIGHVVARHVPERISSQKVLFVIASLLELFGVEFGVSRLFTTFLLDLPNSRAQEKEADVIGLRLMSKACYDPSAAPRVFSRLAELEKKSRRMRIEFLETHPSTERRVQYLEEMLPEALGIVAANPECSLLQERLEAFRSAPVFRPHIQDVFMRG